MWIKLLGDDGDIHIDTEVKQDYNAYVCMSEFMF